MGHPYPGPWSFKYHPWTYDMHVAEDDHITGKKAAQMGYTEFGINYAFYHIDAFGYSVFYGLPTSKDASQFSATRFDPALEASTHLREIFTNVNNVELKRAGDAELYIRGMRSRSQLKSIPVQVMVFDERDEMSDKMVRLAVERMSGQHTKKLVELSTPLIPDHGVDLSYSLSSQDYYTFKCPSCSKRIHLEYPESLVITGESLTDPKLADSHLICFSCKAKLPHEDKVNFLAHKKFGGTGENTSAYSGRAIRGFRHTQLYSMTVHPSEIAASVIRAQTDPEEEEELYNSKLALCSVLRGGQLSEKEVNERRSERRQGEACGHLITTGIDVGSVFHVYVAGWTLPRVRPGGIRINDVAKKHMILAITVPTWDECFRICRDFKSSMTVVDAEPERRGAMSFVSQLRRAYTCDYIYTQQGREIAVSEDEQLIRINRTAWMDMSLFRYRNGGVDLPSMVSQEFVSNIVAPIRKIKKDRLGNPYAVYLNSKPDHFAHAEVYAEVALPLAFKSGYVETIRV